jgi:hypothetical protein
MSYQEKKTIASLVSGILVLAAYCIHVFAQSGMVDASLKDWAVTMLIFIGIGVGVAIVIQIIFHIIFAASIAIKEKDCDDKKINQAMEIDTVEDEMVKLIELKSSKAGYVIAGLGFVAGLVSLVLNASPSVMLNIFFISCGVGSIIEGVSGLYYYRKGVANG